MPILSESSLFDLLRCYLQRSKSNREGTERNFDHYLDDYLKVKASSVLI